MSQADINDIIRFLEGVVQLFLVVGFFLLTSRVYRLLKATQEMKATMADAVHWLEKIARNTAGIGAKTAELRQDPEIEPAEWFFSQRGENRGPYTLQQMRSFAGAGAINFQTLVMKVGSSSWTTWGDFSSADEAA